MAKFPSKLVPQEIAVDPVLTSLIVLIDDVLPVGLFEEVVSFADHRIEEVVRVAAVGHRATEVILRV